MPCPLRILYEALHGFYLPVPPCPSDAGLTRFIRLSFHYPLKRFVMYKLTLSLCFVLGALMLVPVASAQDGVTVECKSRNYQYEECWAGMLNDPALILQKSSASCILNRNWGFNQTTGYLDRKSVV